MYLKSLRFKLTVWYVLILGVLLISFSTFLYVTLSKSLHHGVDNKLQALAGLIASESGSPSSQFGFRDLDQMLAASLKLRPAGKFIQVLDESGRIGQSSDNLRNVQLPVTLKALINASRGRTTLETVRLRGNPPLRIITFPVLENARMMRVVQVASSLEDVEDALNTLFIILIITVPSALLLASLGGQFLASKALNPVDQVTQTARTITSQNLNQRIPPPKVHDEISRLIDTFNDMISRLDKSFSQIKQFSTDASHELKTPLTILRGEVEVALRKERNPSEYEQVLKSNLEEINRMSRIVEDLLLLTRTDMGEIPLNKENVNITKVLGEVVDQLGNLAQAKNLEMVASNHDEEVHIFADAFRLRQLFLNLIENSIKYTEPGGSIRILIERDHEKLPTAVGIEQNPSVRIVVMDTGIGIAKEDQDRVFDRFFRVDKARSRDQGGSGLGLSICKWIVEAHQGQISVESDLGKGSRFVVRLPLPPQ